MESTQDRPDAPQTGRRVAGEDPAKREQILDGAKRVFMEQGFEAASMNDITRAAGVATPPDMIEARIGIGLRLASLTFTRNLPNLWLTEALGFSHRIR